MKIAVTAASGHLGASIVNALLALIPKGNIIALARTPEKAENLGVEVRPGDYENPTQLQQSLQGIDTLLLVSGMDEPSKRIGQHRNVINAAKQVGVNKIVYTSIRGAEEGTAFSPVVQSNRQTEQDVIDSGLDWVIGRNGIYIEPDIEYIDNYKKVGHVFNCADKGLCGYTTRPELAYAYARMLSEDKHNGKIYNLNGEAISQQKLTNYLNDAFDAQLTYQSMSVEDYRNTCSNELGDFLGTIIAGIYQGIREDKVNNPSDFLQAAGREHQSWDSFFTHLKGKSA
ncbi:SDR family oxidoreductase [uncultured Psychromonas sp.]|uniref:SDR family oxidoreductase n=1 Tax=uncultured Psychromonas sp. TaxID=173974 RepID=UPI0026274D39|nr:SDR family oxidoreductase [uncultured Psychromonas sp.]